MDHVRPAAVAGTFYPGAPKKLAADLRAYLGEAATLAVYSRSPEAVEQVLTIYRDALFPPSPRTE